MFEDDDRIVPIEAKAEIHTRAKSYHQYCERYSPKLGFRFSMKNVAKNTEKGVSTYSLPLYLLWRLPEYLRACEL